MKYTLGLDLGTNSIGWALVGIDEELNPYKIINMGSRIIPMSQDILDKFGEGITQSNTAERTGYRGVRRLRERTLLRRERLHRLLHKLGFLPKHYDESLGWDKRVNATYGKFIDSKDVKLAWKLASNNNSQFLFYNSYLEMVEEFKKKGDTRQIPIDWTIYYLRKKALSRKITKEELAWIILQFNQKRGYYQLRGEDEEDTPTKTTEYHALVVDRVELDSSKKNRYLVYFTNGWLYRYDSKSLIDNWVGTIKELIVTTEYNEDGSVKTTKDGDEKRSFRMPKEDDWTLIKKKTELDLAKSNKTVGAYIFDELLLNPSQKIIGDLIRTIERKFYKKELRAILKAQVEFHDELKNRELFVDCVNELYPNNLGHSKNLLSNKDITHLIIDDILFYQRPLKSKKSLIDNCPFEYRVFVKEGKACHIPIKCIAKSNPYFQEFRLWQFIDNLKIIEKEAFIDGKLQLNQDVTAQFLSTEQSKEELFDWLNSQATVSVNKLMRQFFKLKKEKGEKEYKYTWNYVEDREYPCNETKYFLATALKEDKGVRILDNRDVEYRLWHLLYSVEDPMELEGALKKFGNQFGLTQTNIEALLKIKPFKKEYGAYSEKAIKRLLPLMRLGKYWKLDEIDDKTLRRINYIIDGEVDDKEVISTKTREVFDGYNNVNLFKGIPLFKATYLVYNRHAEVSEIVSWDSPEQFGTFINQFKQHSLRNPIVEQVVLETLRTVKDIWDKYGKPTRIHIELGRDLKNPSKKRELISQQQRANEKTKSRMLLILTSLKTQAKYDFINPYSSSMQEKLRLMEEVVLNSNSELPEDIKALFNKLSKENMPTAKELERYMLWLDQKYLSPYTGRPIALAELFTNKYEIEHVIPKKRFYDDSFSNKVICESAVNSLKGNRLALDFIQSEGGKTVQIANTHTRILKEDEYQQLVARLYGNSKAKLSKLLADDIPNGFSERQMNDSRYISRVMMGLLSNIVRGEDESDSTSKYITPCNGKTTTILKNDWGLNDVWNTLIQPRFERLNGLTDSDDYGAYIDDNGTRRFQIRVPMELQSKFNKKRIDHRHHAMDALVIACTTKGHIQYINNINNTDNTDSKKNRNNDKSKKEEIHYGLQKKLCIGKNGNSYLFKKPWDTFTENAKESMQNIVVTHKKNTRILTSTTNSTWCYKEGKKVLQKQTKGEHFAIRKPLHQETIYGRVSIQEVKTIALKEALKNWQCIVDKSLKDFVKDLMAQYGDQKVDTLLKYFKDKKYKFNGVDIKRVEVYQYNDNYAATRKSISSDMTIKQIAKITDASIRAILMNHLLHYNNDPKQAFTPEGIVEMNKNMMQLNGGKPHHPIYKVRLYEDMGNKFSLGSKANNSKKYAVAAKGTNLFFGIYENDKGERKFNTIALNEVIQRLKEKKSPVPNKFGEEYNLKFWLSPNDLVYVPSEEEKENPTLVDCTNLTKEQKNRIYKMVSSTSYVCYFTPTTVAEVIESKIEFGSLDKSEKTFDKTVIKQHCWKLKVDRLGNISELTK